MLIKAASKTVQLTAKRGRSLPAVSILLHSFFVVFLLTSIAQLPPYNPDPNQYPTNPIQFNILPFICERGISESFDGGISCNTTTI